MTKKHADHGDGMLLLWVGGLVTAGAVAIAALAAWSSNPEGTVGAPDAEKPAVRQVARQEARPPEVMPAFATQVEQPRQMQAAFVSKPAAAAEESTAKVGGSTVGPEFVGPVLDEVEVDPDADFVAVGLAAWEAGDHATAAAYFGAESQARPGRPWTDYILGLSLWKADRLDEAVEAMERSITSDPTRIKAHVNLSRIENDRGEYDAALAAADAALEIDLDDPVAVFLRGRSLRNLERSDEAVEAFQRSIELSDDNGHVFNLLGLTLLDRQDPEAAVDALTHAAELEAEVGYIHNNLGMALELTDRRTEAMAAYRRAVEVDPGHEKAAMNLARLEALEPSIETPEAGVAVAAVEP